jgi:glycosyltransferase involved in cell wall biosynthesis
MMRILQLHNRYQIAGGEDGVVQAEHALLKAAGHGVELLEVSNDEIVGAVGKAIAAASAIYSPRSRQRVEAVIDRCVPDIVHVHNFFPLLSPAVYDACRSRGIPVVQTLHNYRLICPKAMLFRNQQICRACVGKPFALPGVVHGCYRDSRSQTAIVAAMLAWHWGRGTWQMKVDRYITLTAFQAAQFVQAGVPAEKIVVKPNFVFSPAVPMLPRDVYTLFVGRLSEEKGVGVLIAAYVKRSLSFPLKIVGDGPLRETLQQQVTAAGLDPIITFLGRQPAEQVRQLMQQAQCLVFPSIWYEGFPLTIAEAFACGLPVLVPQLGSMAEIVQDNLTGKHFIPGDPLDLARQLEWVQTHPTELAQMSQQARRTYEAQYTPEENYRQLIEIYQQVLADRQVV